MKMLLFHLFLLTAGLRYTSAIDLDPDSEESIYSAASTVAQGIFDYYENAEVGNGTKRWQVGLFPSPPNFWWQSGAVWGAMVDYWAYTGDDTYLNMTLDALLAQRGPRNDYIMPQQSGNEGNDDQQWWIFTILDALEHGMPPLPCSIGEDPSECPPTYLAIANKAFNEFVRRWRFDSDTCKGGLRWQYNSSHSGYNYKNSIANGGFFQIAARLAKITSDPTYASWATRIWNWESRVGLLDRRYNVYDGATTDSNCKQINHDQWSYNVGVWMYGAAMMYSYTGGAEPWSTRVQGLLTGAERVFFSPFKNATNIMYESRCEGQGSCNTDQQSFKAYLARFMGKTAIAAPLVQDRISTLLKASAVGAASGCSRQDGNTTCGSRWYTGEYDGETGLGENLASFEVIQALLAR